jgi:hypothetical protein
VNKLSGIQWTSKEFSSTAQFGNKVSTKSQKRGEKVHDRERTVMRVRELAYHKSYAR